MKPLEEINKEAAERREEDLMRAPLRGVDAISYVLRKEALSNPIVADRLKILVGSRELGSMNSTRPTVHGTLCSIIAGLCRQAQTQQEEVVELQRKNQILRSAAGIGTDGYRLKKEVAEEMLDKDNL